MIVRYGFTRIAGAAVGIATAAAAFVLPTTAVRAADAPAGLDAYYAQALQWASCSSGLSCAWLTVPLDYAKPDGQTIRLRVGKAAMTGPAEGRQGSLVVNPGGPAAPAVRCRDGTLHLDVLRDDVALAAQRSGGGRAGRWQRASRPGRLRK